jgi:predicted DNA-binding protein (MmcQ/YjbR family)
VKEGNTEEKRERKSKGTTTATPGFHLNRPTWVRSGLAVTVGVG